MSEYILLQHWKPSYCSIQRYFFLNPSFCFLKKTPQLLCGFISTFNAELGSGTCQRFVGPEDWVAGSGVVDGGQVNRGLLSVIWNESSVNDISAMLNLIWVLSPWFILTLISIYLRSSWKLYVKLSSILHGHSHTVCWKRLAFLEGGLKRDGPSDETAKLEAPCHSRCGTLNSLL